MAPHPSVRVRPSPSELWHLFRCKPFLWYWIGQAISQFGDEIYSVAVVWQAILLTDSKLAQGTIFVLVLIPRITMVLLGGVISDRFNRLYIMIASDAGRMLLVAALGVLSLSGRLELWHLYVFSVLFGLIDAFFWPASRAILPSLVPGAMLGRANAVTTVGFQVNQILGPAAGGLLVAFVGPGAGFVVDGATFLVSLASLALVLRHIPAGTVLAAGEAGADMWASVVRGIRYTLGQPFLRAVIFSAAVFNLSVSGPFYLGIPHLLREMGFSAEEHGFVRAICGGGAILAALLLSLFPPSRRRGRIVFLAVLMAGLFFALVYASGSLVGLASLLALYGFFFAVLSTVGATLIQTVTDPAMLGRVGAVWVTVGLGFMPLSYALTGFLLDRMPASWLFLGAGSVVAATGLAALFTRGARETH